MALSKVRLQYPTSDALRDDGEITWCKYVCGFPEPRTYDEEYEDWRHAMKREMEQDRILISKKIPGVTSVGVVP